MRIKPYWPVTGWSIFILILSWIPGDYIPRVISFSEWLGPDKLAHVVMFGGFSFLLLWALSAKYKRKKSRIWIIFLVLMIGMVFGFLTELVQRHPVVARNGNAFDFGADVTGLALGIMAFHIFYKRKIEAVKNI